MSNEDIKSQKETDYHKVPSSSMVNDISELESNTNDFMNSLSDDPDHVKAYFGQIEIREYYQTSKIDWMQEKYRWSVEIMHWHLDITFKEDANKTLDKDVAQNMNIIRKWVLSILKTVNF